jgi:hypothetical protein
MTDGVAMGRAKAFGTWRIVAADGYESQLKVVSAHIVGNERHAVSPQSVGAFLRHRRNDHDQATPPLRE